MDLSLGPPLTSVQSLWWAIREHHGSGSHSGQAGLHSALAEMLAGFCSLGMISGNQVASAWVWKAEQKSTQAVGYFTNWGYCPQELGLSSGHWHIACAAPWGEQTGTFSWSELRMRKHPVKFSVNYCLDSSLKTSVLMPLVYSFVGFFRAGDRTVL